MTVFKTILKILNRLKGMLILYTIVLLLITVLNQTTENNVTNFEETKPIILVINNDKENGISEGLEEYIKSHSKSVDVDTSDQDAVNDAIFYRDVNYVIYIPKNFGEDILEGKSPRVEYKSSGDQYSSYSEMLVEK